MFTTLSIEYGLHIKKYVVIVFVRVVTHENI